MATSVGLMPGITPEDKLRLAASKGQLDKVKELVISGASFDPDKEGRTALHYAALNGFGECVQLIAAEGCEIDLQDNMGYTALHRAAAQGHLDVIKVLLSEGAIVDRQDDVHGNAALHEASWNGYSRTLELLCKAKANVHLVNKAGFSALHLAAQNGHNQSARVLLYAGASPDHRNNYGDTSLHTACRYGHAGVTRILISARCRVNEQNKNGDTGLHIAAALKRRKIAKLLVDCGVDVNVRNKQNETAIDVAKRKDHTEIIVIITSQPKTKKDKKKKLLGKRSEKEKLFVDLEGEKKKKGFFFRKKSKPKEKDQKQQLYSATAPSITAASELTTSHYDAHLPPHVMQYKYQQVPRSRAQGTLTGAPLSGPPGSAAPGSVVSGVAGQYQTKPGVAVYRDLAGNIKQGPAGFAPVCNCGPMLKRIEQRMDGDRANVYDHIDASHRTLGDRIDHLDRRAAQQIYALDKVTRDRVESDRQDLQDRMEKRFLRERLESERQLDRRGEHIKNEIKAWMDHRLSSIEQQYGNFHADCSDDLLHGRNHQHGGDEMGGGLFRSKSDETLSMSSTHPTKKHARLYAKAIQDLKKMRAAGQKMDKRTRGLAVRDHPVGAQNGHCGRPLTFHEDLSPITGRSPEGNSGNGEFLEGDGHESLKFNSTDVWSQSQRQFNEAEGKSPSDSSSTNQVKDSFTKLHIDDRRNTSQGMNSTDNLAPLPSHGFPKTNQEKLSMSSLPSQPSFTMASFNDDHLHTGYNVRHFKTDSGSNPDSGYGGKGRGLFPDQHNSSMATTSTDTSSPVTLASTSEGGSDALTPPYSTGVSNLREKWFKGAQQPGSRQAEERPRHESEGGIKNKIRTFEGHSNNERIRMNPAIASRHGTEV